MLRNAALILVLLATCRLAASEYEFQTAVQLRKEGATIVLVSERNRQELTILARNVVAVMPADRKDNNSYTSILTRGSVIKLLQRANPADVVVRTLEEMGFDYVQAVADRDNRDPDIYLINLRNIDLIERSRTDTDRGDTTIFFNSEAGGSPGRFAVNQSADAYHAFSQKLAAVRW